MVAGEVGRGGQGGQERKRRLEALCFVQQLLC